jgi:predicted MFS family arabinose efflux permease
LQSTEGDQELLTTEFVAVNAVIFLVYCNIAVFFYFHYYLRSLPIAADQYGFLIAVFSLTGLVVRPVITPFLNAENATRWTAIGCIAIIATLFMYGLARDFWSMAVVRVLHGLAYVGLGAAVITRMVACIPQGRSGQAFGLMAVLTLLPYAVIPPLLEPLTHRLSFLDVLYISAGVMFLAFPLLELARGKSCADPAHAAGEVHWRDLFDNLKDPRVMSLLVICLLVWTTFAPVFFFLKEHGERIGVSNPGLFFTFSTLTEISVRVLAGRQFDRSNKVLLLGGSLVWLAAGYIAMAHVSGEAAFYAMGLFFGLGWGVAMPLLNGVLFDISEPKFRALNTNLSIEMFQAGFVVGPILGGALILQWGYSGMYYAFAGVLAAGLAMCPLAARRRDQSGST